MQDRKWTEHGDLVIGTLLTNNREKYAIAADKGLQARHFRQPKQADVYNQIMSLYDKGKDVDLSLLTINDRDWKLYCLHPQMAAITPSDNVFSSWVDTVIANGQRGILSSSIEEIQQKIKDGVSLSDIVQFLTTVPSEIMPSTGRDDVRHHMQEFEDRYNDPKKTTTSTGIQMLDKSLGGFNNTSEVVGIEAPSGQRKSTTALVLAWEQIMQGRKLFYATQESSGDRVFRKLWGIAITHAMLEMNVNHVKFPYKKDDGSEGQIKVGDFKLVGVKNGGKYYFEEHRNFPNELREIRREAYERAKVNILKAEPRIASAAEGLSRRSGEFAQTLRRKNLQHGCDVFVVDTINKFPGRHGNVDDYASVSEAMFALEEVCRQTNSLMIVLSQVNKGAKAISSTDESNARGGGALKEASDVLLALGYRHHFEDPFFADQRSPDNALLMQVKKMRDSSPPNDATRFAIEISPSSGYPTDKGKAYRNFKESLQPVSFEDGDEGIPA